MVVAFSNKYSPEIENAMRLFYETLSEKERRRYVAVEALKIGHANGLEHDRSRHEETVSDQTKGH